MLELTGRDAWVLEDYTYPGEVSPVLRVGDTVQVGQGQEAWFIWLYGNVVLRTENEDWMWEHLAFEWVRSSSTGLPPVLLPAGQ